MVIHAALTQCKLILIGGKKPWSYSLSWGVCYTSIQVASSLLKLDKIMYFSFENMSTWILMFCDTKPTFYDHRLTFQDHIYRFFQSFREREPLTAKGGDIEDPTAQPILWNCKKNFFYNCATSILDSSFLLLPVVYCYNCATPQCFLQR